MSKVSAPLKKAKKKEETKTEHKRATKKQQKHQKTEIWKTRQENALTLLHSLQKYEVYQAVNIENKLYMSTFKLLQGTYTIMGT